MTTVKYSPREEVIIHELIPYDTPEELVSYLTHGLPGPFPPLNWVEGLVLSFKALPHTDEVSKEIMEGKLHWDSCFTAPMPEFQNAIIINEGMITVNVLDVSANPTFRAIGKTLREEILPSLSNSQ